MADSICELIAEGNSLTSICKRDGFPSASTVFKWLSEQQEFSDKYARAREAQADYLAAEIIDISSEARICQKVTVKGNGDTETVTQDQVDRSRLMVDARKWYAGKLSPKKYGDKIAVGGADDLPPVQSTFDVSGLPTEVLAQIMAAKDAANKG